MVQNVQYSNGLPSHMTLLFEYQTPILSGIQMFGVQMVTVNYFSFFAGLLGVSISADHGGIGGTWADESIVLEEQAYAHCHAPAITVHSSIVMPYLVHYGTQEQIEK